MPDFNLQADVWFGREYDEGGAGWSAGKPVGVADAAYDCAIQIPKQADAMWFKYLSPNLFSPIFYWGCISRQLLLPARTVVQWPVVTAVGPPLVADFMVLRVPHDREQWYYVPEYYDIGRGHANEFRVAAIIPILEWWSGTDPL